MEAEEEGCGEIKLALEIFRRRRKKIKMKSWAKVKDGER
jgi:hypothetical protein